MNYEMSNKESNGMYCGSYARFSSDMQRKATLEDQERQCRKLAEQQGWVVLEEYVRRDAGKSGTSLVGRDGLASLIADAKKRPTPFQMLLIDDTSRLGRNVKDVLEIVDQLAYYEVHVYFVSQKLDSRQDNFRMMLTLYSMIDEQYISRLAKNVWRGQEGQVLKGFTSGSRCFGYRSIRHEALPGDGVKGRACSEGTRLEIIESEAQTIRRVYDMFSGGLSVHKIVRILNGEKVPAARKPRIGDVSTSWNSNLINRILRNERYIGTIVWNRTKQFKDRSTGRIEIRAKPSNEVLRVPTPHLRIVTDEMWSRVQGRLRIVNEQLKAHRLGGLNRAKDRIYLFSGLLRCGVCDEKIVITGGKGSEASYGCKSARYGRGCPNNLRIRADRLAAQLMQALGKNLLLPETLDCLVEHVCAELNEQLEQERKVALAESGEELAKRKAELEMRIENLLDQIEQTSLPDSSGLKSRYASRRAELAIVNQKICARRTQGKAKVSVEETRRLVTEKVDNLLQVCLTDLEMARKVLQDFIHTLVLIPVDTPDGPIYEVMGDVDLFAGGDDPPTGVMLEGSSTRTFQHYESFRHWFAGVQIDPRLVGESEKGPTNANALCDLLVDLLQREPSLEGTEIRAIEWAAHFTSATGYKGHFLEPKNIHHTLRAHPDAFHGKVMITSTVDNSGTRWYSFRLATVMPGMSTVLPLSATAMEVSNSIAI